MGNSKKLDEIVDFSGVEKYLDTPVKRYSSGMKVRLGFAVAAHLEPEILIVDEVLAVGDAEFQKKCIGKMQDVSTNNGRTILFVSHNMAAVSQLCSRSILLGNGEIEYIGDTIGVVSKYFGAEHEILRDAVKYQRDTKKEIQITEAKLTQVGMPSYGRFEYSAPIDLNVEICVSGSDHFTTFGIVTIWNDKNQQVLTTTDDDLVNSIKISDLKQGKSNIQIPLPSNLLTPGNYSLLMSINKPTHGRLDCIQERLIFEILDTRTYRGMKKGYRPAVVSPEIRWRLCE
jgi:lipopolysaccharide transport system ATP-binding protein